MTKTNYLKQLDVTAFLERPEVEAYIGKNYGHFKQLWQKDYTKKKAGHKMATQWHWNTLAFLLPVSWFAYRKMWGLVLSIAGILVFLTLLEGYAQTHWNFKPSNGPYIGLQLVLCFMSKNLYFLHVTEFFRKHKDTPSQILMPLAEKTGGVSVLYSVLGTIGFIAALIGAAIISEMIWPSPTGD